MKETMNDLKLQITDKNILLNSLDSYDKADREKINRVKKELDALLYLYYKSLACSCGDTLVC